MHDQVADVLLAPRAKSVAPDCEPGTAVTGRPTLDGLGIGVETVHQSPRGQQLHREAYQKPV